MFSSSLFCVSNSCLAISFALLLSDVRNMTVCKQIIICKGNKQRLFDYDDFTVRNELNMMISVICSDIYGMILPRTRHSLRRRH